ncbi:hypothetical protein [Streptomyces europaeiscabiei]|uniref:hypothetical protein n=1 Tax=Streptomyces europaeiscabiei TaxID=146819 RepID=UPI002E2D3711|nr:hypothetical protein [Streptomyces europaeiscabiei]
MSTQPIPENVEALAIEFANREADRAVVARSPKGSKAIARRLRSEAAARQMPVKAYIEDLLTQQEGVTPPEGTNPTSAFWSYGIEHPDAPKNSYDQNFLDNRYVAEAWASLQNDQQAGSAQTLETTESGRRLNAMYLWEKQVLNALGGADKGFTEDWTRECWATLSETYATAAKGPVAVFAQYADTRSILYNRELPTLHANGNVGLDNIYFAYESPMSWPKEARSEVGTNAARAQLQYNDPTKAHYVDPKVYATQDPGARTAALTREFSAVVTERNERAAEKITAEQTTAQTAEPVAEQTTVDTAEPTANNPAEQKVETEAQPEAEVHVETQEQAAAPTAPAPSASVPLWQVGFNPKPVKIQAGDSSPTAAPVAPPAPDLGKQATGTGLG